MNGFGILEYDNKLVQLLENKILIEKNSEYEVEIRANMIIVINYIYEQINKNLDRIDINDFIWLKCERSFRRSRKIIFELYFYYRS